MRAALLAAAAILAASASQAHAAGAPLSFAPGSTVAPQVSSNWGGYALVSPGAAPVSFTDVTGTWVEPTARCTAGRRDASAFWVGLGGYDVDAQALEQLGTAAECSGGTGGPVHYAWWEVVPAASVRIPLVIEPGDTVTAALLLKGQTITFSLRDVTRRTRFSKVVTTGEALDTRSAEWIAEAPSRCASGQCSTVPLTNFGTVTFTRAAAIGNDHPGTISDGAWAASPIELVTSGPGISILGGKGTRGPGVGAVPGDVSADGRSFSVSWAKNLAP